MRGYAEYLRSCGITEPELSRLANGIRSWSDLHRWLDRNYRLVLHPPLQRTSPRSPALDRSWQGAFQRRFGGDHSARTTLGARRGWEKIVTHRLRVTLAFTIVSTAAILYLSDLMLHSEQMPLLALRLYLVLYGTMVFFLASSFYKMMLGTWHALRGPAGNPWHPQHQACAPAPHVRVAIVYPVYHEAVDRVAAGMAATWGSIAAKHPHLTAHFDVFLLSDSYRLEYWVSEEAAIHRLREAFPAARFFYRRRSVRRNAKLGNIIDFCRRWGRRYDYMLMMDADSVMDGDAVVALLRMMEGNHRIGILQTNPTPILRTSLFGRMQQFAGRLYGSVFSYSLQSMYMGHGCYIGHNAMIRLEPFIDHCILPILPGPAPWGGKPLSHDIVESAMMARAGYEVWFLPEIEGSYEEIPGNILSFFIREQRWMQGNMQHLRFLFVDGLRSIHRDTFITGSMGYASAPLWAGFLVVSAYSMFRFLGTGIAILTGIRALTTPILMLTISSIVLLFLPRLISLAIHIEHGRARRFGGKDKVVWSMVLETLFSFVFSPLMMIFISRFFWQWLKRKAVSWGTQDRGDGALAWPVCLRQFGWVSVLGIAASWFLIRDFLKVPDGDAALLVAMSDNWLHPSDLVIWLCPILAGFVTSPWIVRVTSFSFPWLKARQLFAIPEEIDPPAVIKAITRWKEHFAACLPDAAEPDLVADYAISSPQFYVWHRPLTRSRPHLAALLMPKLRSGARLSEQELRLALSERNCFDVLHAGRA